MRALILGDIHLGGGMSQGKQMPGSALNSRVIDQLNLLEWTLEQAVEEEATDIILTGDIFEEPKPNISLIVLFLNWLKKCSANDISVHIIQGNHDVLRSGFIYSSPLDIIGEAEISNVYVYKDIYTINIGTTAFTMAPFRDRKSLGCASNAEAVNIIKDQMAYEVAGIPLTYKKVLVGHLAIEGSLFVGNEVDNIANELFCTIDMLSSYDYVWMGHVHKPQVLKKNPHIAHIGSMDVSDFGESDHDKIIVIVDCYTGEFFTKVLPTRNLKKINIVVPEKVEDTTAFVLKEIEKQKSLNNSIVRVEISLSSPELKSVNRLEVEKHLLKSGVFNINGVLESKKTILVKKEELSSMDTKMDAKTAIKSFAEKYVSDDLKSDFIETANEIYELYRKENS